MRGRLGLLAGALALVAAATIGPAAAQDAPAPSAAVANPMFDSAKAAADGLGPVGIAAIQRALIWTGDLNTLASGEFGRRTFDAIRAFQRRAKVRDTGILLPAEHVLLDKAAARAGAAYGFATLAAQGVSLGYPAKLATRRTEGRFGPKFSSPSGDVTVDILRYPAATETADALFERLKAERPGRTVSYALSRPDAFVISGTVDGKSFYMRFLKTPGDTRGFVLGWNPSLSPDFDRVAIAMAVSMAPVGDGGASAARTGSPPPLTEPVASADAGKPAGPPVPLPAGAPTGPRRGIGFVLGGSPYLVTSAAVVAGCVTVRTAAGADASVVAGDGANGIALVRLTGEVPAGVALRAAPLTGGEPLVLLSDGQGAELRRRPAEVRALAGRGDDMRRFTIAADAQDPGVGIFDASGALVGLPLAEGAGALKPQFLAAFLRANGAAPGAASGAEPERAALGITCDPSRP